MLLKPKGQTPHPACVTSHPGRARPAPEIRSGSRPVPNCLPNLFVAATVVSQTTPGHQKVLQASFWTPFGSRFGSKLAIVAPCENLIIYYVFITKTLFGPGRVPNKTLTCIHNASETTFCVFLSPPWRPRGAPGLKTELPDGPEASQKAHQNPSKSPQNPLWSAILCFRASWGAPPNQK